MSRGVKVLVSCLIVLLIASLFANFLLLRRGRGECGVAVAVPVSPVPPAVDASAVSLEDGPVPGTPEASAAVPAELPSAAGQPAVAAQDSGETVAPVAAVAPVPQGEPASAPEPFLVREAYFYTYSSELHLNFTRPLTENLSEENLVISPEVDIERCYSYWKSVDIKADFQPGTSYSVTVRDNGEEAVTVVIGPDHAKKIEFQTYGRVFPLSNDFWNLPLSVENLGKNLKVQVMEAYPSLTLQFLADPRNHDYTHVITEKEIPLKPLRNSPQHLCMDLAEMGIVRKPGLYWISLKDPEDRWMGTSQSFIVTDLGVFATCASQDMLVAVRSLKDCGPVAEATVRLYSRKFQLLGQGTTGADGLCRLPFPKLQDEQDSVAYLIVSKGDDQTICSAYFDSQEPCKERAKVYPERGVCRPGESIHVYATLRDRNLKTKGGVPVEFVLRDPRGNRFTSQEVTGDSAGLYAVEFAIPENAVTGRFSVDMMIPGNGGSYGSTNFMVAEYVPDRIRLSMECTPRVDGKEVKISGKAGYYFGTPFTDGELKVNVVGKYIPFTPKGFEEFTFGDPEDDKKIYEGAGLWEFQEDGSFDGVVGCDELRDNVCCPVEFTVEGTCIPRGAARAVSTTRKAVCHFADCYLGGCKRETPQGECVFRMAFVDRKGREREHDGEGFRYQLYRVRWDYVLKEVDSGQNSRVWERFDSLVREGDFRLKNGLFKLDDIGHGRFVLVVRDPEDRCRLRMDFWHWGGETGSRMKDPRQLVFDLDKEKYLPGENALVSFECNEEGQAVVMPGLGEMGEPISFPVKRGTNQFSIPIPQDLVYGGWYAAVHVVSRKDTASDPIYLSGKIELSIAQENHRLKVDLAAPEVALPGSEAPIQVTLSDDAGKPVSGEVLLWAVDQGILSLTAYQTPMPFGDFFGKPEYPLDSRENYSYLYPVLNAGTEKIGGGASATIAAGFLSGNRERLQKPAVLFLGILKTDSQGKATVTARIPEFSGALRFMAIAVEGDRTGSGETETQVRSQTSLEIALPRAVAPGDEFQLCIQGFNHDLPDGTAHWKVVLEGCETSEPLEGDFALAKGGSATARLTLKAPQSEGKASAKVFLTLGESEISEESSAVVRPSMPPVKTLSTVVLQPGENREFQLEESGRLDVGNAALAVTGSLDWLTDYPYGCLEQITAAAFPFLSAKALVASGMLPAEYGKSVDQRIQLAIQQLVAKRCHGGWMSMWEGLDAIWYEGSIFAYLFLIEADRHGFPLDAEFRGEIVRNLKSYLNDTSRNKLASRAFAGLVLAYASPKDAFAYTRLLPDKECDGFCRFLKAMTVIRSGHSAEGMPDLEKLLANGEFLTNDTKVLGLDSPVRRMGMALWLLADTIPEHPAVQRLSVALLSWRNAEGHWGTTQDNAWAALGLARYCLLKNTARGTFSVRVEQIGRTDSKDCSSAVRLTGKQRVRVTNTGTAPATAFLWGRGVQTEATPCAQGMTIHREYQDLEGRPVFQAQKGQLLRVVLKIVPTSSDVGNFVFADLLPGGLEIEDDVLATRSHVFTGDERRRDDIPFDRLEKRFDRFLAFGDLSYAELGKELTYSYLVRAVTPGTYSIPPASMESMYHPELHAMELPGQPTFLVK